jgi:hypothetical protein
MGESRKRSELNRKDIFGRLADHGLERDYGRIKQIVAFAVPQWRLFYVKLFGKRTIADVLDQIERWNSFLNKDFFLPKGQQAQIKDWIRQTENLVWQALVEINLPRVGDWDLTLQYDPTGRDDRGQPIYIFPSLRLRAFNRDTQEIRESIVSSEGKHSAWPAIAYRKAFEELGLWHLLYKGSVGRHLVSQRKQQGWPLFTVLIIPSLYEFMLPHYRKPPHHSEKRDVDGERQQALFPNDLFGDMLEVLRMEHPFIFERTSVQQLKSAIQRHLARNAKSTKSRR